MKKLFLVMFSLLSIGTKAENLPRYTENQKAAVNRCRTLDTSVLNGLKSAMVAQSVTSGTAGLANVGSFALTLGNNLSAGADNNKAKLASNIMTGVGTAESTANIFISSVQLSKVKDLISDIEACQEGLASIPTDAEATTIKSDNNTYLKEND